MAAVAGRRLAPRVRRGSLPADDAVVEGAPDLAPSDEARDRLAQAFADVYGDVLLDALARQERGASPVEAIRVALAEAEGSAS